MCEVDNDFLSSLRSAFFILLVKVLLVLAPSEFENNHFGGLRDVNDDDS